MKPLDRMLDDHVTPVLTEAGFRRRGRKYQLTGANGDLVCLDVQQSRATTVDNVARPEWTSFCVNTGAVPDTQRDWLVHVNPLLAAKQPDASWGLWWWRLSAPDEVAVDPQPWGCDWWLVRGDDDFDRAGALLGAAVRAKVPLLMSLLDRNEFLRLAGDPAKPLEIHVSGAEIMLRVDDGPSPELDAELAELDRSEQEIAQPFAAWIRKRAGY